MGGIDGFSIVAGMFSFFVLSMVVLGAATNLFGAVFPEDDTTQQLADRIDYLVCGGGFGVEKNCPSDRYARNVFVASPRDPDNPYQERLVVFQEQGQTIHFTQPGFGIEERVAVTNPVDTAAVCKFDVAEPKNVYGCAPIEAENLAVSAIHHESFSFKWDVTDEQALQDPTHDAQYYAQLYDDSNTYSPAVIQTRIPQNLDDEKPSLFHLYLEYTPARGDKPPRLLVTNYDEGIELRAQSIS